MTQLTAFPAQWLLSGLVFLTAGASAYYTFRVSRKLRDRTRELEQLKSQMLEWNRQLEQKISERTRDYEETRRSLENTYLETVTALVEAMTAKDTYLFGHSHNVAGYAKSIAQEMGLSRERTNRLLHGCELHDLGKIAVPDTILMKPGPLTKEEFEIVKQHPVWGARILEPLTSMKDINEMVHQEHERWDGTGYPQGIKGEQIRLEARIIAVADALDAMISTRPYRESIPLEKACKELQRCGGTQFDPKVVEACIRAIQNGKLTPLAHEHPNVVSKSTHGHIKI